MGKWSSIVKSLKKGTWNFNRKPYLLPLLFSCSIEATKAMKVKGKKIETDLRYWIPGYCSSPQTSENHEQSYACKGKTTLSQHKRIVKKRWFTYQWRRQIHDSDWAESKSMSTINRNLILGLLSSRRRRRSVQRKWIKKSTQNQSTN